MSPSVCVVQQKLLPIICCHVKISQITSKLSIPYPTTIIGFKTTIWKSGSLTWRKQLYFQTGSTLRFGNETIWDRHYLIILSNSLLYTTKPIVKGCELTEGPSARDLLLLLLLICFLSLLSKNGPDISNFKWYIIPLYINHYKFGYHYE